MKNNQILINLQKRLKYSFKNVETLNLALTHRSAHHKNNERLEFLGDAILNLIVAQMLYQQFECAHEGELTRARASLVKQQTLAEIANELSLGDCLHLGLGEKRSGGFRRDSILADALEAIVGAIYLDSDFENCRNCISKWFATRMDVLRPQEQEKDPKTQLQEYLQSNQKSLPRYEIVSISGEPHAQFFTVKCVVNGFDSVEGEGTSRRIAEQKAARKMLENIHCKS